MNASNIPLLTDIVDNGDPTKVDKHREPESAHSLTSNSALATLLTTDEQILNQKIEQAIDAALPTIKQKLQQQLLSALTEQNKP